jgi:hypothetical protein
MEEIYVDLHTVSFVNMDYGEAKFVLTKILKNDLLVFACERQQGFVYGFRKRRGEYYDCTGCIIPMVIIRCIAVYIF